MADTSVIFTRHRHADETMQHFAALYEQGYESVAERKHVLLEHSDHLERQRLALDHCTKILAYKLQRYEEILGDRS